jgi:hypothetical protein
MLNRSCCHISILVFSLAILGISLGNCLIQLNKVQNGYDPLWDCYLQMATEFTVGQENFTMIHQCDSAIKNFTLIKDEYCNSKVSVFQSCGMCSRATNLYRSIATPQFLKIIKDYKRASQMKDEL